MLFVNDHGLTVNELALVSSDKPSRQQDVFMRFVSGMGDILRMMSIKVQDS